MSNRHLSRTTAFQSLFEWDFNGGSTSLDEITKNNIDQFAGGLDDVSFIQKLVAGVVEHVAEIDLVISENAPEWPIEQIPAVDRSVLRLGVFELMHSNEVPPKVVINEAVELAKTFAGETSGKFVNGVLGTIYKKMHPEERETKIVAQIEEEK
mgnify:CR=1 FL=1